MQCSPPSRVVFEEARVLLLLRAVSVFLFLFLGIYKRLYTSAHAVRSSCLAALFMVDSFSGEKGPAAFSSCYCAALYGVRSQVFATGCATNGRRIRRKGVHCSWSMSE